MYKGLRIVLCILSINNILIAQESVHNRLAVQDEKPWQTTLGAECSLLPLLQGDRAALLSLQSSADILINNKWYVSLSFPIYLRLPLTVSDSVAIILAQGDLNFTASWIGHSNRGQHRFGMSWTAPTGISATESIQHSIIQTGGTLHHLDLFWQYTRYTDPVSLDLGIRLGTGIPGTLYEAFYWEPLAAGITSGATMLMNRWLAFQVSLLQSIMLPPRSGDHWTSDTLLYQARLTGGLWYTEGSHSFGIELGHDMANPWEGLAISVRYSYTIKPKTVSLEFFFITLLDSIWHTYAPILSHRLAPGWQKSV
ncbi:MAG: hypothetical protein LDL24_10810 [Treponema sp.]|nr:hypothetical protein [Treponema sp.]